MAIEVAKVVPDVHFLIVGSTLPSDRDQYTAQCVGLVNHSGIANRFHFTGQVADTAPYLRMSTVFVLPSYREGFPRSIVEAMGCGLPVVATNIRGCREAVEHGESGFVVPPRDSGALAERVTYLLENPEVRSRFRARARELAVELYDERMVQAKVVTFMREVFERDEVVERAETVSSGM